MNYFYDLVVLIFQKYEFAGLFFITGWLVAVATIIISVLLLRMAIKRLDQEKEFHRKISSEYQEAMKDHEKVVIQIVKDSTQALSRVSEKFATLELIILQTIGRVNGK